MGKENCKSEARVYAGKVYWSNTGIFKRVNDTRSTVDEGSSGSEICQRSCRRRRRKTPSNLTLNSQCVTCNVHKAEWNWLIYNFDPYDSGCVESLLSRSIVIHFLQKEYNEWKEKRQFKPGFRKSKKWKVDTRRCAIWIMLGGACTFCFDVLKCFIRNVLFTMQLTLHTLLKALMRIEGWAQKTWAPTVTLRLLSGRNMGKYNSLNLLKIHIFVWGCLAYKTLSMWYKLIMQKSTISIFRGSP